ncbi:hypothetical protein BDN71DRAFT_644670 [Pleurotus eryngii]|uniref:Uncharacterized protein n=1 Tax=Pleurotus eryngii TaxID=5323 RepID=A0A9P5ZZU2_PLEER|nr:hypothetical protein BDN71DRAFT_644670 [Pleurotus eryngii]
MLRQNLLWFSFVPIGVKVERYHPARFGIIADNFESSAYSVVALFTCCCACSGPVSTTMPFDAPESTMLTGTSYSSLDNTMALGMTILVPWISAISVCSVRLEQPSMAYTKYPCLKTGSEHAATISISGSGDLFACGTLRTASSSLFGCSA